ncbi:hypothetical protein RFI_07957 [Reticulomyxa filosa]|uniref:Uncharacterized protein n=1 Tax=Reticulomyxa filosa TaxID=46433 RepID=X6NSA5_RETFI|nr:hypothetical protein RFI_07957 [Reticulomyxa filosa]|eukprot:ETO29170.1 hypothetical protein RFI_07957 [Reticulomyxa filosa]
MGNEKDEARIKAKSPRNSKSATPDMMMDEAKWTTQSVIATVIREIVSSPSGSPALQARHIDPSNTMEDGYPIKDNDPEEYFEDDPEQDEHGRDDRIAGFAKSRPIVSSSHWIDGKDEWRDTGVVKSECEECDYNCEYDHDHDHDHDHNRSCQKNNPFHSNTNMTPLHDNQSLSSKQELVNGVAQSFDDVTNTSQSIPSNATNKANMEVTQQDEGSPTIISEGTPRLQSQLNSQSQSQLQSQSQVPSMSSQLKNNKQTSSKYLDHVGKNVRPFDSTNNDGNAVTNPTDHTTANIAWGASSSKTTTKKLTIRTSNTAKTTVHFFKK